jgi:hypothetical protein
MKIPLMKTILSVSLGASGLVGLQVLATDSFLRAAAPSHAYGLVAFAIIDLVLAASMWFLPRLSLTAGTLVSAIQFLAMTADMFIGAPAGLQQNLFREYLVGNPSFLGLLELQSIIFAFALSMTTKIHIPTARSAAKDTQSVLPNPID